MSAPLPRSSAPRCFFWLAALLLAGGLPASAAAPLAQDYSLVYHNSDPEYYVEGCGLEKLPDGSLLAVVPVVPRAEWSEARRVEHSVIHLLRSSDAGQTWQELSTLPYYSAVPWVYDGRLFLFGCQPGAKSRNDDLVLLESGDGGVTWSPPVTLFKGHYWNCHTGMVLRDRRLYWAVDDLSLGKNRGPALVVGDLSGDIMNPAAWRISPSVEFPGIPDQLTNPKFAELPSQYLEPNVFEINGHIRVLAVVKAHRQTTAGLCAVLDGADNAPGRPELKFTQYSPMPGGHLKFCVIRDEPSRLFWATANLSVSSQGEIDLYRGGADRDLLKADQRIGGNDRRLLMLMYSLDGLNWLQAGCVALAPRMKQSFNYARPVVDGEDLAIIARSNLRGSNAHDADNATFHRVKNFRSLALDLWPQEEPATPKKPAKP